MARSVVLGNSSLTVGLNERGLVHDFYYPYVGLENLTTARMQPHHIGVWVNGVFSWLSDDSWVGEVDFQTTALVSLIDFENKKLGVTIRLQDFVDVHYNIFARKLTVMNHDEKDKDIRVFFHQVFQISALGRADTVMYVPDGHYMLDYKGRCSILAYAECEGGEPFDQYAAGNAGIEGKEGTFRDSEDGELSMSAVEHGGVDSTIRVKTVLPAGGTQTLHYWLAVADNQNDLEKLHDKMLNGGFAHRLNACYQHWSDWFKKSELLLSKLPETYDKAVRKSLLTIKAHTDKHGGIIASCDSSIYNYGRDYYSYVWPRDGAFVMWPLIKLGYTHEPRAFFEFCKSIMHPDGYLMHKYQPDKAIGSTWHPLVHGKRRELAIQEDETAVVVFMLSEYLHYSNDVEFVNSMYEPFIKPACDFMVNFIDEQTGLPHASYDLWEEKFLSSTYTAALTAQALLRASSIAESRHEINDAARWHETAQKIKSKSSQYYNKERNVLNKGFLLADDKVTPDDTLDISSFYGAWMFDFSSKSELSHTLDAISSILLDQSPSGGTPRYEDDAYFRSDPAYRGNPWFVTTLWLAQYYASIGNEKESKRLIDWTISKMTPSGVLSEQVNPSDGSIVGVTPLVWSHAELINAIIASN